MKPLLHAGVVYAFCACVTGCAAPGTSPVTSATATPATTISALNAKDAIAIGKSTKTDVIAALGKTTVVSFDSGYEVWVYRIIGERITGQSSAKENWIERLLHGGSETGTLAKTEFVILFDPSGVVTKTRIRPAPPLREAKGT